MVRPPARHNVEFFCAVVIVGLLAGVAGLSTTFVLRIVQHLTYNYSFGTLLAGVTGSSPVRRLVGPMVGAALAGLGSCGAGATYRRWRRRSPTATGYRG
jgi:hypothetical protein